METVVDVIGLNGNVSKKKNEALIFFKEMSIVLRSSLDPSW